MRLKYENTIINNVLKYMNTLRLWTIQNNEQFKTKNIQSSSVDIRITLKHFASKITTQTTTVKPVLNGHSKEDKRKDFQDL